MSELSVGHFPKEASQEAVNWQVIGQISIAVWQGRAELKKKILSFSQLTNCESQLQYLSNKGGKMTTKHCQRGTTDPDY